MERHQRGRPYSRHSGAISALLEIQAAAHAATGALEWGGELGERRASTHLRHIARETARAQAYLGLPQAA